MLPLGSLASSLQHPKPMAMPIACVDMAIRHPIFPVRSSSAALFSSQSIQSQHLISYTRNVGLHRKLRASCFWSRQIAIFNVGSAVAVEAEGKAEVAAMADTPESQFISVLLLFAFVGLTLFTFGVTYLGVKDFQEKREREKLLKQEEAQEKQKDSKKLVKPGPRGFGQKSRRR